MNNEENGAVISISEELSEGMVLHKNLKQEIIITEENRFRLYLIEYSNSLKGKSQWASPLGIFVALIVTISTVTFQDIYTLTKDTWKAIYILTTILSFFWLLYSMYCSYLSYKKGGIDSLIKKLKTSKSS